MVDPTDPQRDRLYCAQSLALALDRPALPDLAAVEAVIAAYSADLGLPRVPVEVRGARLVSGSSSADFDLQQSLIRIDPPPIHELLIVHELAHVAAPTPEDPHGPTFARTFLDLVDRNMRLAGLSYELRACFRLFGVRIEQPPGPWAKPHFLVDVKRLRDLELSHNPSVLVEIAMQGHFAQTYSTGGPCLSLLDSATAR